MNTSVLATAEFEWRLFERCFARLRVGGLGIAPGVEYWRWVWSVEATHGTGRRRYADKDVINPSFGDAERGDDV